MMPPADSRHTLLTTYVVQDQSNKEEIQRLASQDQLLTTGMGGVLPEQSDPTRFSRVLDVGCGTGGWLIELAKAYPAIPLLIGVDANAHVLAYARERAEEQGVSDRVEFHRMDVLRMLEFPNVFFDLVNHRFAGSWLRTWDWRKLLQEYQRVCRPGGIIRITEADFHVRTTSAALEELFALVVTAFFQAGHLFEPESASLLTHLVPLLQRAGLHTIQTRTMFLEYHHGTPQWQAFVEDMRRAFRTMVPFLQKWTRLPDDYDALYQQALAEMERPDFVGQWDLVTVWGVRSPS